MEKLWLKQEISVHPDFPNIRRFVNVRNAELKAEYCQVVIEAHITYTDSNNEDKPNTSFKSSIDNWILTNDTLTTVMDLETQQPVHNPDYVDAETTPDVNPYLQRPSFDYFFDLVTIDRVDMISLLEAHIAFDDALGEFNF